MSYAGHVGRVGALAVALGFGMGIAAVPGVALADSTPDQTSAPADAPSADTSPSTGAIAQKPDAQPPPGDLHDVGGTSKAAPSDPAPISTTTTPGTTTTTGSQATTTLGGGDTPKVTISVSSVDLSSTAEGTPKAKPTTATHEDVAVAPEVATATAISESSPLAAAPVAAVSPPEVAPTNAPAKPTANPLPSATLSSATRESVQNLAAPSAVTATVTGAVAAATPVAVIDDVSTDATGTTTWPTATPIVPGNSVQLSMQQMSAAQSTLFQQTWGQGNVVAGLAALIPAGLLVQAQLSLLAWQMVNPSIQGLVAGTVGIPIVHEVAELGLNATMMIPKIAQSWLDSAQTFTPLVGALGSPGAASSASQLMSLAAQNGQVYASVPLHMLAVTEPVVYISVNGGPSVPVVVDTGSAGLVIDPQYVPQAGLGAMTGSGTSGYSGGLTYDFETYTTTVDFGSGIVTAPTSVNLVSATSQDAFANYLLPDDVVGVLGIGPDAIGPGPSIVTTALPGELKDGVLIDEVHGVLTFGPNPLPARTSVAGSPIVSLTANASSGSPEIVWVIIDSGGVTGTIPTALTGTGQLSGDLPAGVTISVYTADGATLIYSYVTTGSNTPMVVSDTDYLNTGYTPFQQQPIYTSNSGAGGIGTTYFDYL